MSWADCFLGTDQPGRFARMDLPLDVSRHSLRSAQRRPRGRSGWPEASPIILALTGRRSGDALRTTDGSCPSGPARSVASLGGLGGPAVWLDPVPALQLHQALDLTMEALVLPGDRLKVDPGRPCPLPPRLRLGA